MDVRGSYRPRVNPGSAIIYLNGTAFDLYLDFASVSYTSTVYNIQHTITRGSNTFTYDTRTDNADSSNWHDLYVEVDKNTSKKGLYISCPSGVPIDDTIYTYNVQSIVRYQSGKS